MPRHLRVRYAALQMLTLLGAIVGAKLAMLAGDLGWPRYSVDLDHALFSGKSLVGGLLGGFVVAEIAKPWFAWKEPPNDWFACKLLLSVAIGRVGCILAGCCRGLPTASGLAIVYSDGVPRVPVTTFEALFHAILLQDVGDVVNAEPCLVQVLEHDAGRADAPARERRYGARHNLALLCRQRQYKRQARQQTNEAKGYFSHLSLLQH